MYVCVKIYIQQEDITSMRHEVIFQSVQSLGSFFHKETFFSQERKLYFESHLFLIEEFQLSGIKSTV